jgi:glycosyltransferase involved in cell wall biosynthesis
MISVVCPFYNEEAILEKATELMLKNLSTLEDKWELILVNDGSRDTSLDIVQILERKNSKLHVVSYPQNRGRGYAIRQGVQKSRGNIVVTTEVDCSWGDDIVHRIVQKFKDAPGTDIVIASPHLPGGTYKNVPPKRVFLSRLGNQIIRAGLTYNITMNTGMTRGYKRDKFLALPLDEDEKEMHLEIVNKALAFDYTICEIPAVLEWKAEDLTKKAEKKRKSSSNINKLIRTHLVFSLIAAPFRYIFVFSGLFLAGSAFMFLLATYHLFTPTPSIYFALTSFFLALFGFLIFTIGVLAHQAFATQRELWRIRYALEKNGTSSGNNAN